VSSFRHSGAQSGCNILKVVLLRTYSDYIDRVRQASGTFHEIESGGSNPSSLRRILQLQRGSGRTSMVPKIKDYSEYRRSKSSASFRVIYSGYQFCGPSIQHTKRLVRDDMGINPRRAENTTLRILGATISPIDTRRTRCLPIKR